MEKWGWGNKQNLLPSLHYSMDEARRDLDKAGGNNMLFKKKIPRAPSATPYHFFFRFVLEVTELTQNC